MHDFLRVEVSRPFGPADDPMLHISEGSYPADDTLRGRPGVNGTLLLWYPETIEPVKVAVVDGVVGMPLEDLLDAVRVRVAPPDPKGLDMAGFAHVFDGMAELAGTLTCNLAYIQDIPEGQMH